MTEHACEERRPSGGGGGWRGLCGPGVKCAVFFPEALTFPHRIFADSRRGVNETCAPTPAEVTARKERWRDCVQGHVSTAATTGRQWRDIVVKGGSITNPPSLERQEEDLDVQIEQRKIPIEALYPNTAHAKPNATSPNSSKSIAEELSSSHVNYPYATDTSSIIGEHNFADVKHSNCVPLFTTHQASLSTDSKRPAHEYLGAMQQSVSLNAYPFRYKRDPYVGQGDLGTNVYPYTKSDGGVTEETSCTALKSHTVAWDNCGTRLHGVHSACDPPSAHEKHARSPEADLDMDSYIEHVKSNMREIMPSMDFQLPQRSRSQSPNAVSSQSSCLSASPQRSDSGQSDNSNAASLRTRRRQASSSCSSFSKSMKANECISVSKSVERTKEQVNKGLRSSAHKRCRRQSSLSSRSRSQSPLTHTYQSRNNHLLKRNRNSSRLSRSRNRSPSIHSSRSRSRSPRKNDRRLHRSPVSRKRSPSSTTSLSSSRSSSSCRKAHHAPHFRSRKHYTRKRTSQSSRSSRSRSSRSSLSRGSRSPRPRGSRSPRPRGSSSPRPRGSRSPRPRGSRSPRPRGSRSPRPRGSRSPRPRGSRSSQPRSSSSSRSRSLTPHSKGRHSSQIQKSPSTSTHPLGSSENSDEDTTQRKFGVKVQFHKPELDDKRIKENIFRLFHKFGFVTYVKIIHSGSERFAVVYFSRLYEQQAAIYGSSSISLRDTLHVSLWTGKEEDEQHKRDNTPPKATQAKLSQEIKLVSDFCGPNIFRENNIALHPSSSRTLFIGKLPKTIAPAKLDMICEKFENIVDIEVEQTPGESTCSALIEFSDIVSLINAGKVLDRNFFGIDGVKLGFAEMKPTNCLWVDGLPPCLTSAKLMAHFAVYGPTAKMLHDRLLCRALILYKQREDALFAVKQTKLRQVKVFGSWLMLDFASDRSQLAFCQSMQESGQNAGNFLHE